MLDNTSFDNAVDWLSDKPVGVMISVGVILSMVFSLLCVFFLYVIHPIFLLIGVPTLAIARIIYYLITEK